MNEKKTVIWLLLLYTLIVFSISVFQTELILQKLDFSARSIARFTAYFSVSFSLLITDFIFVCIFYGCWIFTKWQRLYITAKTYLTSVHSILTIFIIGELIRLGWLFFFFTAEIKDVPLTRDLINHIRSLSSMREGVIIQICYINISTVGMYLNLKENNISFKSRIAACSVMLFLLLIYTSLYLLE